MSWGIEKREERISSQLEKLLNQNGKTDECKSYRVLNLGIGSQHQYQATLIFQFYKYLLDGIIFMGGHNECYQGAMLDSGEPVRFPIMNIHNTIQIPSPVKFEIAHLRKKLRKQAQVISEISFFKISFIAKYIIGRYFTSQTQKLDKLSFKLENEGKEVKFELPHFKDVRLQPQFPDFDLEKFLYSDVFEKSMGYDGKNIMTQVLKVVYVEPLKDAWHLAKNEGIKFMWAIQPLLGAVDKQKTSQEKYFISRHPMLQKSCHEALSAVSEDLEKYGLKKYDLNRLKLFNSIQGNAFLDYVHLNPAGAKAVAEFIFNQTVNNWSEKAKQ